MSSLTVLETRCLKSKCQQGRAPCWFSEREFVPCLASFWGLQACLGLWSHHSNLCLYSHIAFSSLLLCVCVTKFPFMRRRGLHLQPPGWSRTSTSSLNHIFCPIIFTLLSYKLTSPGSEDQDRNASFGWPPFGPQHRVPSLILMKRSWILLGWKLLSLSHSLNFQIAIFLSPSFISHLVCLLNLRHGFSFHPFLLSLILEKPFWILGWQMGTIREGEPHVFSMAKQAWPYRELRQWQSHIKIEELVVQSQSLKEKRATQIKIP